MVYLCVVMLYGLILTGSSKFIIRLALSSEPFFAGLYLSLWSCVVPAGEQIKLFSGQLLFLSLFNSIRHISSIKFLVACKQKFLQTKFIHHICCNSRLMYCFCSVHSHNFERSQNKLEQTLCGRHDSAFCHNWKSFSKFAHFRR